MKVRWHQRLTYWLAMSAIWLAARVPERLGYGTAALLGRLYFRLDGRRRRHALVFLRQAFPDRSDRELLRLGAEATGNVFKVPLDMARLTRLLARGGDVLEVLDLGDAEPRLRHATPYIALSGHIGCWEVAGVTVGRITGKGYAIGRVARNPLLERWILGTRQRAGLVILPRRGGIRPFARALAEGGAGLMVVDQRQRLRSVLAPFFGRIASCERAAVSLAVRHGHPLMVGAALRVGHGFRFRIVLGEAFVPARTGDPEGDVYRGVCEVNRRLEELIRSAPEQYLWIHDRYRLPSGGGASDQDGDGE